MLFTRDVARVGRLGVLIVVAAAVSACTTTVTGMSVAAESPSSVRTAVSTPPSSTPSMRPPASTVPPADPALLVPGWQVVLSHKHKASYDVPPGWKVEGDDYVVGFEDNNGNPLVGMSGAATYQQGFCPGHSGSVRGMIGVKDGNVTATGSLATSVAQQWAADGYMSSNGTPPKVTASPPQPVTIDGIAGFVARDTVRPNPTTACAPPSAVVQVVILPANGGSILLIMVMDQDFPGAVTDSQMQQMINSFRPLA